MKLKYYAFLLIFTLICSCDNDDNVEYEFVQVATPQIMSKTAFRNSVDIVASKSIKEAGKIYVYNDYIFISEKNEGIHIIDNSNPKSPHAIKFIEIHGNEDISVKDNYLYADSATDLLVFDISDINSVSLIERLEDVFVIYDYQIPVEAEAVEYGDFNYETEIIVGWTLALEKREIVNTDVFIEFDTALVNAESTTGQGGSLARFQIVNNYLYTVGSSEMAIFNIQNLASPLLEATQQVGWRIETMFQAENYLYLGSTNGMYIYSLENPSEPTYISEFTHWELCDPVVVDGDYAYLTLRGGNRCGVEESVLEVIDISDKYNPSLVGMYPLDNPYGLGVKGTSLFVCDDDSGLKLFDKTNPLELQLLKTYDNVQSKDVIPLENTLIIIGNNTLYQYKYVDNGVELLSTYSLN
jgi:hypothetical protein